nr:hypothetical protein Iba_scaffold14953CG0070 [Ipomoea batatas]GME19192.1 hypothetical protein Iba_scaffold22137CG0020 [Ipomoea batatas]
MTCLRMVVTQKSLLRHFPVGSQMSTSMLLSMPGYIMNLRRTQKDRKFI